MPSQVSSRVRLCGGNRSEKGDGGNDAPRERGLVRWNTFRHVSSYNSFICAEFDVSRGGGNVLNPDLNRSAAPLLWMTYEATLAGLLMKLTNAEWKWDDLGDVNESLTGIWKLFERLPFERLTYEDSTSTTNR